MCSNEEANEIFIFGKGLDTCFGFVAGLGVVLDLFVGFRWGFLGVMVAHQVTLFSEQGMSLCIVRTSSSRIFKSGVSQRRFREFSGIFSQQLENSYLSGQRLSISETQCQRLNVRVGFTNWVTSVCYASHQGVQFHIAVPRGSRFVMLSFPFLDCFEAFRQCRLATHSVHVLGRLLQQRGIDVFGPV
jgi:hypothetical protein